MNKPTKRAYVSPSSETVELRMKGGILFGSEEVENYNRKSAQDW